jgi:hypothetical protein
MKSKGKRKKHAISPAQIESCILMIRGHKVMLDRHLAELYGVETRALNQAVKRNKDRFPGDFVFSLTRDEIRNISQNVTCSTIAHAKNVSAFTEQGVAMLSSVLRSKRAARVNIQIMRVFVRLRDMLTAHKELARKLAQLEERIADHDEEIEAIFEAINRLMEPPPEGPKPKIGFGVRERSARYAARKKK